MKQQAEELSLAGSGVLLDPLSFPLMAKLIWAKRCQPVAGQEVEA